VPRSIGDPLTSSEVNVGGTLNILLAARDSGVSRIVYTSSSSVYGPGAELPKREDMPATPISPYAVAKLAGEGYCRAFNRVYGLETVSVRLFNVFGPRQDPRSQYSAVIPAFTSALLEGRRPTIFGDGEQSRDFTPVDNTVRACLLAAQADGVGGEVYNAACGARVTVNDVFRGIRDLLGSDLDPEYAEARPGDIPHSLADVSKAERDLGYRPSVTFSEGLERAVLDLRRRRSAA
jgi:nucleoside-diphosphate-sugar epimerase